ncbi:MAG TPA: hypothetical protein VFF94_08360, partial [Novosphingobium sp.]|nr:hypothetical protein [Novosphingobium sp.]
EGARLSGALHHVVLAADAASHWRATAASEVALAPGAALGAIDAAAGITITATTQDPALVAGPRPLPSGGVLLITAG